MARASRSPSRFSLPPNAFQGINNAEDSTREPSVYEQLQKKYSDQNRTLAQTTVKLQCQNTELETELASAQREIRSLKIHNSELVNLIRGKVIDFQEESNMKLNELLESLGGDDIISFKRAKTPVSLPVSLPVSETVSEIKPTQNVKLDYLKQLNQDFKKRKSALFVSSIPEEDETLPTSAQDLSFVEEIKEPESEPDYKDTESNIIPIKRKRDSQLFNTSGPIKSIPLLTAIEKNIPNLGSEVQFQSKKHNPNEAARISSIGLPTAIEEEEDIPILDGLDDFSVNKEQDSSNPFTDSMDEEANLPASPMKKKQKKTRIPRELKNLDAEKTKRWTGVDPLEGRSRRSSIVPRYDIPVQTKTRRVNVFNDSTVEEASQIVDKPRTVLGVKDHNVVSGNKSKSKNHKDMSIFDLENEDFLNIAIPIMPMEGKKSTKGRRRKRIDNFDL